MRDPGNEVAPLAQMTGKCSWRNVEASILDNKADFICIMLVTPCILRRLATQFPALF